MADSAPGSDGDVWAHRTGPLVALDYPFVVRSTDPALGRFLDRAFSGFRVAAPVPHRCTTYSLVHPVGPGGRYELHVDSAVEVAHATPARTLDHLVWHVNRQVLATSRGRVLVHAAGAARGGVGVLLPGGSGAGKSTLVAGLVRAGFGYLSDEMVAIDPHTLELVAYPKPVSLDQGSWGVLRGLAPDVDAAVRPYLQSRWQVPPDAIRRHATVSTVAPVYVIAPSYQEGAPTSLRPATRSEMLLLLGAQTFRSDTDPRACLAVLSGLVRRTACFHLQSGDLNEACAAVDALIAGHWPKG